MRQRRPTGWSPSGLNWPTGYSRNRLADDEARALPVLAGPGCWCGEPYGHDWPGKEDGAPHPRERRGQ